MPPRKRPGDDVSEEESPPQRRRLVGKGQRAATEEPAEEDVEPSFEEEDEEAEDGDGTLDTGTTHQMVKKLVRMALASEYSRQPMRRVEISAKVLGPNGRQFKKIFALAQEELEKNFGLMMVELPMIEKVTLRDRRAAQKAQKVQNSSKSYITTTILPEKFRAVLVPGKVPTADHESAYIGLSTMIISLIYLQGGIILETKLERYLERLNADVDTPIGETNKLLQKMVAQKYLVKVKDNTGGEETTEYMVGSRGRMEVGFDGVWGLCKQLYRPDDGEVDELEGRVRRSMGLEVKKGALPNEDREEAAEESAPQTGSTQRSARHGRTTHGALGGNNQRRTTRAQAEEDDDGEEEEDSE